MKKLRVVAGFILVVVFALALLPRLSFTAAPLADAISSELNSTWASDAASVSIATVFGKASLSAFDSAAQSLNLSSAWYSQAAWLREIASEDGYSSAAINNAITNVGKTTGVAMVLGVLPETYNGMWLVYDRSFIPLYDILGWSRSGALSLMQQDIQSENGKPLLAFGTPGGGSWYYAERYYDEWMQDLDLFLKMGDTADAAAMWNGVNQAPPNGNWAGSYYSYRADQPNTLECEVGFFAACAANYEMTVGNIPNFNRVSADLYYKLLASGWGSPLWGAPSQMEHATSNGQLRLENTLGGIEALQMYYCISDSSYRTAFDSLLTGGSKPAWQYLLSAGGWGTSGADDPAMTAALLFLYGIIPDTGSLAVPTNEWHYEDWTSMMPSSLFKFNYGSQTIQIPVFAGNIKFDFGSSIASYNFGSDGVYQVHFSSDWNTVTSASLVSGLNQFHYLNPTSTPPVQGYGSIQVSGSYNGQAVAFAASYDSTSQVSVPTSGYTFTNVPTGSHTVYGSYNGISKSSSVTISSNGQTPCVLDFSSSQPPVNTGRPIWWPSPLPWPLPTILGSSILSTVVSSPIDMFVAAAATVSLVSIGASRLTKSRRSTAPKKRSRWVLVEDQ